MLPVTRSNVLGNKISEDVFILRKKKTQPNPNILVTIWHYPYLAEKKLRMKRELTTWPTAATGGCASTVQKVGFHTPFLLFMLLVCLLRRLE